MNIGTRHTDGRVSLNVKALKEKRKSLGISQEKLAEECFQQGLAVSLSSIKRAELGENVLYRTATNLAKFYVIPIDELFDNDLDVLTAQFKQPPVFPFIRKPLLTIVVGIGF